MSAFWRLDTCRPVGDGYFGRIPWRDILAMAEWLGLDGYDAEVFCHVIAEMDSEMLTIRSKEMAQQVAKTKAKR